MTEANAAHGTADGTDGATVVNARYRGWLPVALCLALGVFWLGVDWVAFQWAPIQHRQGLFGAVFIGFAGSVAATLRCLPVRVARIELGVVLQTWPDGRRYRPGKVAEVTFGPDPAEDYEDWAPGRKLCRARFCLREARRFDMAVALADAARIREWAVARGIVVKDPDGYSTRRPDA